MSQSDTIWVKVPEKFYGFIRNHVGDLVHMFPDQYKSIQFVEAEDFSFGRLVVFKYYLGSRILRGKYSIRDVDDVKKYILYEAVEGDELMEYRVFRVRFEAVNGSGSFAKWTVEFEKANENVLSPEKYLEFFHKISKGLDAYFSTRTKTLI